MALVWVCRDEEEMWWLPLDDARRGARSTITDVGQVALMHCSPLELAAAPDRGLDCCRGRPPAATWRSSRLREPLPSSSPVNNNDDAARTLTLVAFCTQRRFKGSEAHENTPQSKHRSVLTFTVPYCSAVGFRLSQQ